MLVYSQDESFPREDNMEDKKVANSLFSLLVLGGAVMAESNFAAVSTTLEKGKSLTSALLDHEEGHGEEGCITPACGCWLG
jgi:hypothetical protein